MATVTLSRPDISNRIGPEMASELREVCQAIQEDETIRLVVLTGAGDRFSVGREPMPEKPEDGPANQGLDWLKELQAASAIAATARRESPAGRVPALSVATAGAR